MNNNLTKEQSDDIRELSNELRAIRENELGRTQTIIRLEHVQLDIENIRSALIRDGMAGETNSDNVEKDPP